MRKIAVLALLLASGSALANPANQSSAPVTVPSNLMVDGQVYDFSVSGIRQYLTALEDDQAEFANVLRPMVERLESQRTTALIVSGMTIGASAGLALYGKNLPKTKPRQVTQSTNPLITVDQENDRLRREAKEEDDKKSRKYYSIAFGGIFAAYGLHYWLAPYRDDLMCFVNSHNRKSGRFKMPKIEMNLGSLQRSESSVTFAWSL